MEDKHIFNGELCYSFRLDISASSENIPILVTKLKEYFTRACLGKENKKDGTPHFQGILWRETSLGKNDSQTIRTYYKQKFNIKHKNFMSLTSARKVRSLAKYCNDKEHKGIVSFGIVDLSLLGKWSNPDSKKETYRDELFKKLQSMKGSSMICPVDLCKAAIQIYKDVRPPPFKSLLCLGRSAGYIPETVFMRLYYRDLEHCGDFVRMTNTGATENAQNSIMNYIIEESDEEDSFN